MSSSNILVYSLFLFLLLPHSSQQDEPKLVGQLICPTSIAVEESAASPPAGWQASSKDLAKKFERISVYQVLPEGRELDLAPDGQEQSGKSISQVWHLPRDRSSPVFLRCRYRDTSITLRTKIPSAIQVCSLRYIADEHGRVEGASEANCE
jgi:hypothetical protein